MSSGFLVCRREAENRFLMVVPFFLRSTLKLLWHAFLLHALPTPGAAKVRNSSVSNDGGDSSGSEDSDHDEPIEVGEDEDDDVAGNDARGRRSVPAANAARPKRRSPGKAPLQPAQITFINKCVGKVESGIADDFMFKPPRASMQQIVDVVGHALTWVLVWLPHILWRRHGIPPQPPCPRHGFDCTVKPHGKKSARPRRYVDVFLSNCGWLVGTVHKCVQCQRERAALARSLLMGDLEAAIAHHTGSEWTFTVVP